MTGSIALVTGLSSADKLRFIEGCILLALFSSLLPSRSVFEDTRGAEGTTVTALSDTNICSLPESPNLIWAKVFLLSSKLTSLARRNIFSLPGAMPILVDTSENKSPRVSFECMVTEPLLHLILLVPEICTMTSAPLPILPWERTEGPLSCWDSSSRPLSSMMSRVSVLGSTVPVAACASWSVHCCKRRRLKATSSPASTRGAARQRGREVRKVIACDATESHRQEVMMSENTSIPMRDDGVPTILKGKGEASLISPASVFNQRKNFLVQLKACRE